MGIPSQAFHVSESVLSEEQPIRYARQKFVGHIGEAEISRSALGGRALRSPPPHVSSVCQLK